MSEREYTKVLGALKHAGSIAVVVLLVGFALRARQLAEALAEARYEARMPHPGLWFPELQAETADGREVTLAKGGERQVLLYLQSTCEFCKESISMFNQLSDSLRANEGAVPLYGIQLDTVQSIPEYVAQNQLRFPVVRFKSFRDSRVFAARATPYIVVVDSNGRVAYTRSKALVANASLDSVLNAARFVRPVRDTSAR